MNTVVDLTDVRDASGHAIFSASDLGAAHVRAHAAADSGQFEAGRRELGAFLASHCGIGSEWTHLQFHMALFELECGDWESAYARFRREILPVAAETSDALTDAPGLLWRLALAAPRAVVLPWMPLRNTALKSLGHRASFIEISNLLALAGARDAASIESWIQRDSALAPRVEHLVRRFAAGLVRYLHGELESCADTIDQLIPYLREIGGSQSQNQLFYLMRDRCRMKSASHGAKNQKAA